MTRVVLSLQELNVWGQETVTVLLTSDDSTTFLLHFDPARADEGAVVSKLRAAGAAVQQHPDVREPG